MKKNTVEWSVFAASLVVIAATVATLLYAQLTDNGRPPLIVLEIGEAVRHERTYAVPVDVRNDGDTTAEQVLIQVRLVGSGVDERGEAQITLLPHGSHRRAWVTFSRDPAAGRLEARVLGYHTP